MKPLDLLLTAEDLVNASNGKPRQSNLRRAMSSVYYALFHTLACSCADLLIGGAGAGKSLEAWRQVYRSLDHGFAKSACKNTAKMRLFPQDIQEFAIRFVTMQEKRHLADYHPNEKQFKTDVLLEIGQARSAIKAYANTDKKDRRAFCAYVLLKDRQ
ncbi:hypothetical protein G3545_19145 [Starkeya sp. ORNL1]|uniref:hypothetical protein n=1 Tax=Starkeya sp. ORNL1 TaxID=2709380 RepID=UPI001462D6AF|nr:hypothetical protein [Starkeya sp. ORNL1]QJP15589.1 hypothetical protein G3545_19145 [Starkeya sp. ORNL1]